MQLGARQGRLNNSRKWKGDSCAELLTQKESDNCNPNNLNLLPSENCEEGTSDVIGLDDDNEDKVVNSGEIEAANSHLSGDSDRICSKRGFHIENCSSDLKTIGKGGEDESSVHENSLSLTRNGAGGEDEGSSSEKPNFNFKSKRHSDRDLDNPKPCKCQRPTGDGACLSRKYSNLSFCSIEDHIPDGFYDAGRDRPFMSLGSYEQILHLDSREVILLDRLFCMSIYVNIRLIIMLEFLKFILLLFQCKRFIALVFCLQGEG